MKKLICIITAVVVVLTAVACDYVIVKKSDLTTQETVGEPDIYWEESSTIKDTTDGMGIEIDCDTSIQETTIEEEASVEETTVEETAEKSSNIAYDYTLYSTESQAQQAQASKQYSKTFDLSGRRADDYDKMEIGNSYYFLYDYNANVENGQYFLYLYVSKFNQQAKSINNNNFDTYIKIHTGKESIIFKPVCGPTWYENVKVIQRQEYQSSNGIILLGDEVVYSAVVDAYYIKYQVDEWLYNLKDRYIDWFVCGTDGYYNQYDIEGPLRCWYNNKNGAYPNIEERVVDIEQVGVGSTFTSFGVTYTITKNNLYYIKNKNIYVLALFYDATVVKDYSYINLMLYQKNTLLDGTTKYKVYCNSVVKIDQYQTIGQYIDLSAEYNGVIIDGVSYLDCRQTSGQQVYGTAYRIGTQKNNNMLFIYLGSDYTSVQPELLLDKYFKFNFKTIDTSSIIQLDDILQ